MSERTLYTENPKHNVRQCREAGRRDHGPRSNVRGRMRRAANKVARRADREAAQLND